MIFGSAKAGTPLMLAAPEIALELPLRILVRERSDGRTDLVYIDPSRLAEDFGVGELAPAIAGLAAIAHAAAEWRLPDVLLTCASEQDPEQPFGRGSKDQMRGEVRCELGGAVAPDGFVQPGEREGDVAARPHRGAECRAEKDPALWH